jgi:hypothetical protein
MQQWLEERPCESVINGDISGLVKGRRDLIAGSSFGGTVNPPDRASGAKISFAQGQQPSDQPHSLIPSDRASRTSPFRSKRKNPLIEILLKKKRRGFRSRRGFTFQMLPSLLGLPAFVFLLGRQEIVDDSIRDIASETATSGQVKPEMLSGKNSAQGCFISRGREALEGAHYSG